jgi:hypothetical protein
MVDVLVSVTMCSLLLAFVFFLLWWDALNDAQYWQRDSDHWFGAWMKASKGRPEAADWWKGGGDA